MDDGIRALWAGIDEAARGPGVHVLTGPIFVRGARARRHAGGEDPRHVATPAVRQQLRGELGTALRRVRQGTHHDLRPRRCSVPQAASDHSPRPLFGYDFTDPTAVRRSRRRDAPDPASRQPFVAAGAGAGPTALRRDGRGAGRTGSPLEHPARRVRRQRRQLAHRPRRHRLLSRVHRRSDAVRRRSPLRAGRRRDLRDRDRGIADGADPGVGGDATSGHLAAAGDRRGVVHARLRRGPRRGDARWPPSR